jgi:hypothetical protein
MSLGTLTQFWQLFATLLTFYELPRRTPETSAQTNVIESSFATLRHRIDRTGRDP